MRNAGIKQKSQQPFDVAELGQRLRKERVIAGLSLASLATKVKVTKGYLSRLECGKAKPSALMIERIATAIGTDPSPLYVLLGHLPADVKQILYLHPVEAQAMLRETFAPYRSNAEVQEKSTKTPLSSFATSKQLYARAEMEGLYEIVQADCFEWLVRRAANSIHAVVTDPPYGLKEYTDEEKTKLRRGRGGVWRIPPTFDGCKRQPLPRFTVLTDQEKTTLRDFFFRWTTLVFKALVPGGHVFIATNPLVSHLVYLPMIEAGFEKRGEIIRLVQTLRGGDRPKNAHKEFKIGRAHV